MWSRRCWVSETFVFPQSDLLYLLGHGWSSIYYSLFLEKTPLDRVHTVGTRDQTRDDETRCLIQSVKSQRLTCSNLMVEGQRG